MIDCIHRLLPYFWPEISSLQCCPYLQKLCIFSSLQVVLAAPVSCKVLKVDPEGHYVRRWLPELRHLPTEYIHCPWVLWQQGLKRIEKVSKGLVDFDSISKHRGI